MTTGLITQERRAMGWDDEDERYMNHLDDIYMGRVIELYASATFVRYKEKKGDDTPIDLMLRERVRIEKRHAADRLLIKMRQDDVPVTPEEVERKR